MEIRNSMYVERLIQWKLGTLSFHSQSLCCYNTIPGTFFINGVCIVDPEIKIVDCAFTGSLKYSIAEIRDPITYDTVVFLSSVKLKLSSISNPNIKAVIFLKDVEEIIVDINPKENHIPLIGLTHDKESKIYQFCKQHKLNYKIIYSPYLLMNHEDEEFVKRNRTIIR